MTSFWPLVALKRKRSTSPGWTWPLTSMGSSKGGSSGRNARGCGSLGSCSAASGLVPISKRMGLVSPSGVSRRMSRSPMAAPGSTVIFTMTDSAICGLRWRVLNLSSSSRMWMRSLRLAWSRLRSRGCSGRAASSGEAAGAGLSPFFAGLAGVAGLLAGGLFMAGNISRTNGGRVWPCPASSAARFSKRSRILRCRATRSS